MKASLKYTAARLGLLVASAAALLPLGLHLLVTLMIAVLASAILSFFLLRKLRDQVAEELASSTQRRREQKAKLRSALAGEDQQEVGVAPGNTTNVAGS